MSSLEIGLIISVSVLGINGLGAVLYILRKNIKNCCGILFRSPTSSPPSSINNLDLMPTMNKQIIYPSPHHQPSPNTINNNFQFPKPQLTLPDIKI